MREKSVSEELRVITWTVFGKHLLKAVSRPWAALGARDILVKRIESYILIEFTFSWETDKQVTVMFQSYKEKWSFFFFAFNALISIRRITGFNIQFAGIFHKIMLSIWLWVMSYYNLSKAIFSQV